MQIDLKIYLYKKYFIEYLMYIILLLFFSLLHHYLFLILSSKFFCYEFYLKNEF